MTPLRRRGWDPLAAVASLIAASMAVLYVWIIRQQDGEPLAWVLGGLTVAALLGAYGAVQAAPRRETALMVSAGILLPLGLLAILTIGLPILLAGALALVAAILSWSNADRRRRPSDEA
jgi:hypothetical protein